MAGWPAQVRSAKKLISTLKLEREYQPTLDLDCRLSAGGEDNAGIVDRVILAAKICYGLETVDREPL